MSIWKRNERSSDRHAAATKFLICCLVLSWYYFYFYVRLKCIHPRTFVQPRSQGLPEISLSNPSRDQKRDMLTYTPLFVKGSAGNYVPRKTLQTRPDTYIYSCHVLRFLTESWTSIWVEYLNEQVLLGFLPCRNFFYLEKKKNLDLMLTFSLLILGVNNTSKNL